MCQKKIKMKLFKTISFFICSEATIKAKNLEMNFTRPVYKVPPDAAALFWLRGHQTPPVTLAWSGSSAGLLSIQDPPAVIMLDGKTPAAKALASVLHAIKTRIGDREGEWLNSLRVIAQRIIAETEHGFAAPWFYVKKKPKRLHLRTQEVVGHA